MSRARSQVVPGPPSPAASTAPRAPSPPIHPHRLPWVALLARVFALDVTVCLACGGRLRLIAAPTDPASDITALSTRHRATDRTSADLLPKRPFIISIHKTSLNLIHHSDIHGDSEFTCDNGSGSTRGIIKGCFCSRKRDWRTFEIGTFSDSNRFS